MLFRVCVFIVFVFKVLCVLDFIKVKVIRMCFMGIKLLLVFLVIFLVLFRICIEVLFI